MLGVAFQMLDDLLDVSGPAERTGKHRGTDLLDGTVTLPLILARAPIPGSRAGPASGRTRAEAEQLCDRIAQTGALAETRARAWRWSRRRRRHSTVVRTRRPSARSRPSRTGLSSATPKKGTAGPIGPAAGEGDCVEEGLEVFGEDVILDERS